MSMSFFRLTQPNDTEYTVGKADVNNFFSANHKNSCAPLSSDERQMSVVRCQSCPGNSVISRPTEHLVALLNGKDMSDIFTVLLVLLLFCRTVSRLIMYIDI